MARKALIEKEKKRKMLVGRHYAKRQELKEIVKNLNTAEEAREEAVRALNALPKNSSPIRMRNRCVLTGRPRGNYRKFKISRLCLRELALSGQIPGMVKSSW